MRILALSIFHTGELKRPDEPKSFCQAQLYAMFCRNLTEINLIFSEIFLLQKV